MPRNKNEDRDEGRTGTGQSASGRIAAVLRDEIASGILPTGGSLPPEYMLMERFGVSRPTCREALRILQSEGLVAVLRGNKGGARILSPDPRRIAAYAGVLLQMSSTTIVEVFETRRLVEPDALARVATIGDPAILSLLAQNVAAQHFLVNDRPAFYRKGRDFRELFLENCGCEPLRLMGLMLGYIADRQLSLLSVELPHTPGEEQCYLAAIALKERMIGAMISKRLDEVRACWVEYLTTYMDNLLEFTPEQFRSLAPYPLV